MSLYHDLQTVVFPYLDVFTKMKFSHINWILYENMFRLNVKDVHDICEEYYGYRGLGAFLKRRLGKNISFKLSTSINCMVDEELECNEEIIIKKKINKILKEYYVPMRFFMFKYNKASFNNIIIDTGTNITFQDISYYCLKNIRDVSFYKKLLKVITRNDYNILVDLACCNYCQYAKLLKYNGQISPFPFDRIILKLLFDHGGYYKIYTQYKDHVNNYVYDETKFLTGQH
jgi:hypothetical protein